MYICEHKKMSKFLIAGLGNIGDEYAGTRHNIGFDVLDYIAKEAGVKFRNDRLADVAEVKHKGKILILIKPTTYMNLSGKAINYWLQNEKISVENLLVVVDELALPLGKIRIGPKGSDGGHNGLKNIQELLKTTEYPRLRFGISNEFSKGHQVNYVLGKWSDEEQKTLEPRIKIAAEAIKAFAFIGLRRCMNEFNNK
jgi:PTH1 family peptidyl-tRNA hydrolase